MRQGIWGWRGAGALLIFSLLLRAGVCSATPERPLVVASIRPLQLIVNDLAGDWLDTRALLEGQASPHHFSLSVSQAKLLDRADLLLWVGPEFESFLAKSARGHPRQLAFAELLADGGPPPGEHHHGHAEDLHLWLAPEKVAQLVVALQARLAQLLPQRRAQLAERSAAYRQGLQQLQGDIERQLAPHRRQGFAVFHHGYSALVEAFALNQLGYVTAVPDEQVSAHKLAQLQNQSKGARCLIAERGEARTAQRYAAVLNLPLIEVDLLAAQAQLHSYPDYLHAVADAFAACLSG